MKRRFNLFIAFVLIFLCSGTAYAQAGSSVHNDRFWQAAFWNNTNLAGEPQLTALHQSIDWDWGYGSPDAGIANDYFSVRWTRTLNLPAGVYQFTTRTDDGVRLWVNETLLIDQWREQPATTYSARMAIAGAARIRMEYFEREGAAAASLTYDRVPGPPPPTSEMVIVDNDDPGFVKGGSPTAWRHAEAGYDGHILWTRNNDHIRPAYNWARWYPDLSAGRYEVYVYVPERRATTSQARYWVSHYDGYTLRIVNQGATSGWLSLGVFRFRGDGRDFVSLADVTFEPYLSTDIGFDAVKWERR